MNKALAETHHWSVDQLELCDFRNCVRLQTSFGPGINWISGQNGQGKTSVLEALYVCITGQSFRTPLLRDLIRYEQPGFNVQLYCTKHDVEQKIRMRYTPTEKQVWYNQTLYPSRAPLCGRFPCVIMTSEDLQCIRGAPQERRTLIDAHIAQIDPLYLHHQSRYTRALKQRNSLLKERAFSLLAVWEAQLSQAGAYIALRRFQTIKRLSPLAEKRYSRFTPFAKTFSLEYETEAPVISEQTEALVDYYQNAYLENRHRESLAGTTLLGPHRDDLIFLLDGHRARSFASEGEQRSCMNALRMAELDALKQETGIEPILLIDDLALSLDPTRTISFLQQLQEPSQVFVTTAQSHNDALFHSLCENPIHFQFFMMHEGLITRQ